MITRRKFFGLAAAAAALPVVKRDWWDEWRDADLVYISPASPEMVIGSYADYISVSDFTLAPIAGTFTGWVHPQFAADLLADPETPEDLRG